MNRTYIAAAALLLGTSALAWAQNEPVPAGKDPLVATTIIVKPTVAERIAAKEAPIGLTKAVTADPETADAGWTDTSEAGVGGPVEPAEVATSMTAAPDITPRPAAHNYPPCDPGPGDDNCIQLYEPGVRTALASWNQPSGGLMQPGEAMASAEPALDEATTAVGGPYEPLVAEADETAMNGDEVIDPAAGESADTELAD
ncbi:MAG TPA: hypothetical protein VEW71_09120 [Allosphingosinicella sp.]|nr:hypothetical protein [Allosphingosinicella sp.]